MQGVIIFFTKCVIGRKDPIFIIIIYHNYIQQSKYITLAKFGTKVKPYHINKQTLTQEINLVLLRKTVLLQSLLKITRLSLSQNTIKFQCLCNPVDKQTDRWTVNTHPS